MNPAETGATRDRVILVMDGGGGDGAAGQLARAVARRRDGQLILAATVEVAAGESLSEGTIRAQELRQQLSAMVGANSGEGEPPTRVVVRVGRDKWSELAALATEEGAGMMVIALGAEIDPVNSLRLGNTPLDEVLAEAPCDVVLVREAKADVGRELIPDVLLAVRGGPHAELAFDVCEALSADADVTAITSLHVIPQDMPALAQIYEELPYRRFGARMAANRRVRRLQMVSRNVERTVLTEAARHRWTVMGMSAPPTTLQVANPLAALGAIAADALLTVPGNLVLVKTRRPIAPEISRASTALNTPPDLDPETLSLVVDKWFAENTFHADEFRDLDKLVAMKRKQGLTISLGLPALNEEATVGKVISVLKEALYDRVPLLDEIVLIDSNSDDRTREIGDKLGIPVYIHQQTLPEVGAPLHGKGEALWKSLHLLKGDIIVWVDTDITNMTPQFVYGLVGPLLAEPRIKYVKGYYRRPIRSGTVLAEDGGGRVTELTARPLFNLFYPQLSGLIQPLSGEYAGRREALEQLPFFSGYGVETGLLIDILEGYGLSAIGQVNLGQRIHRNQSLRALSTMSFAIMQVILERVEARREISLLAGISRSMKLIKFADDQLSLELKYVHDTERPPIATIEAYQQAREAMKAALSEAH